MNHVRITYGLPMAIGILGLAACSAANDGDEGATADDAEIRQRNIACSSPRLTAEGYRGDGAFVGNDGQVYVKAKVCIQDDDGCGWAQCDGEEGGGDWNGGPKGDWYGFWDTGEPMRGACTVRIANARCGGDNGSERGVCNSPAHGNVMTATCVQEADWKWYQCKKNGTFTGAYGPHAGEVGTCSQALWFDQ